MSDSSKQSQSQTGGRAFDFIHLNPRDEKPRSRGLTEIRGPYYSPVGPHYLSDLLEMLGAYVDSS
jgi:phosphosulfolactate synthase (CoM biosynthesis protein A)